MDIIDLWWNASQQEAINELRAGLVTAQAGSRAASARQAELLQLLQLENDDLRLRLAVLIRLLVNQGTLSAEQYAAAIAEAKESIARTAHTQAVTSKPVAKPKAHKLPVPKSE